MPYPDPEPTPASDSYGTPQGVAALALLFTNDGEFIDPDVYTENQVINPTLTTVVDWIDQISAMLNKALEAKGFTQPLTRDVDVTAASALVEEIVSDLVRYVNQKGRFFSDKFQESGESMWRTIREDILAWVDDYAATQVQFSGRGFDAQGRETFPIFQRNNFGNRFGNPE